MPLLFGIFMVMLILTWRRGTRILANKTRKTEVPLEALLHSLEKKPPHIVPGTAVFLTSDPEFAPTALLHNLKHNKVLHEQNVILTIITEDTPRARDEERVTIAPVSQHFMRGRCASATWRRRTCRRRSPLRASRAGISTSCPRRSSCRGGAEAGGAFRHAALAGPAVHRIGQERSDATDFFQIPTGRVVEIGTQVTCEVTARRDEFCVMLYKIAPQREFASCPNTETRRSTI